MKKFILALVAMVTMTVTSASAMSYEQARQQALFLTDKMAYELNLTDDQYEAAYEINLDYLMGVNTADDLYGVYWRQRNLDLSYILLDWQYRSFLNASYFYRPLYWDGGYWHFGIYARYPHRDYFFFGRPNFFTSYHGGHSWRMNGGRSWYNGRNFGGPRSGGQARIGMRDGFNRGDYGRGQSFGNMNRNNGPQVGNNRQINGNRPQGNTNSRSQNGNMNSRPQNGSMSNGGFGNQNRSFGNRQSSTRTTVTRESPSRNNSLGSNRSGSFGGNRSNSSFGGSSTSAPSKSFTPRSTPSNSGSFGGGNRSSFGSGHSGGNFGGSSTRSGGGSFGGGSHGNGGGSFGGRR